MPKDRKEYMRAYYLKNKEKLHAKKHNPHSREISRKANERYRQKRRLLSEIAAMPVPTIEDA